MNTSASGNKVRESGFIFGRPIAMNYTVITSNGKPDLSCVLSAGKWGP